MLVATTIAEERVLITLLAYKLKFAPIYMLKRRLPGLFCVRYVPKTYHNNVSLSQDMSQYISLSVSISQLLSQGIGHPVSH